MSACNILLQHKSVHMMVDAAAYDTNGVVVSFNQKAYAIPTLPAAVSATGPSCAAGIFARDFGEYFSSFDQLVGGLEHYCREFYAENLATLSKYPGTGIELSVIGWSASRGKPEGYNILLREDRDDDVRADQFARQAAEVGNDAMLGNDKFKLRQLDGCMINPPPYRPMHEIGFNADEGCDGLNPEVDLLHILQAQRLRKFSEPPMRRPSHIVGGFALLTTVSKDQVNQKIVHRWTEDRVGEVVAPKPIENWAAWRSNLASKQGGAPQQENPWGAAPNVVPFAGLSRQQRRALARQNS